MGSILFVIRCTVQNRLWVEGLRDCASRACMDRQQRCGTQASECDVKRRTAMESLLHAHILFIDQENARNRFSESPGTSVRSAKRPPLKRSFVLEAVVM